MCLENGATRAFIELLAKERYFAAAEYLWANFPTYAVFRHKENKKWYAVIMQVEKSKLALHTSGKKDKIDILNVKCDALTHAMLLAEKGILPAYHMHRGNWVSIVLDGSVDKNLVASLLDMSFQMTLKLKKKK